MYKNYTKENLPLQAIIASTSNKNWQKGTPKNLEMQKHAGKKCNLEIQKLLNTKAT